MRLIDADALRKQFEDRSLEDFTHLHFIDAIDSAPTVEDRPSGDFLRCPLCGAVEAGFSEVKEDALSSGEWVCPKCKTHIIGSRGNYCPMCGKRLDEETDDE